MFRPRWYKSLLYVLVNPFMLNSDSKAMGGGVRRLAFRKAKKRDVWDQSSEPKNVGVRWDKARRSGGKTSFSESSD